MNENNLFAKKIRIFKTHSLGDFICFANNKKFYEYLIKNIIKNSKIIYIVRDGRDVMVSLYNYLLKFNKISKNMSFNRFLLTKNDFDNSFNELNRIEYWSEHVESWINIKDILIVKYEDLYNSYEETLRKISIYLNKENDLLKKIKRINLVRYNKLQRGVRRIFPWLFKSTAILPRKGIVGDWRNYFDKESAELFEYYGGSGLRIMNYEKDNSWIEKFIKEKDKR